MKRRVVVLGAGFGGLRAAKLLANNKSLKITVVSPSVDFTFTPLLHDVAVGTVPPHLVSTNLPELLKTHPNLSFMQSTAELIDVTQKRVTLQNGKQLVYDALLVATGASPAIAQVQGAAQHTLAFKTHADAVAVKARIEQLQQAPPIKSQSMNIVVVGGGANGVELAAQLQTVFNSRSSKSDLPLNTSVALIEHKDNVLTRFPQFLQQHGLNRLQKLGVNVWLGARVQQVQKSGLVLHQDSKRIALESSLTIWTAGVKANLPQFAGWEPRLVQGRLAADSTLQVRDLPGLFVLGDAAAVPNSQGDLYPMLAQIAHKQAETAAHNIKLYLDGKSDKYKHFHYRIPVLLLSLGRYNTLASIKGLNSLGILWTLVWRLNTLWRFYSTHHRWQLLKYWVLG